MLFGQFAQNLSVHIVRLFASETWAWGLWPLRMMCLAHMPSAKHFFDLGPLVLSIMWYSGHLDSSWIWVISLGYS